MQQPSAEGKAPPPVPKGLHGWTAWLYQSSPAYRDLWAELQRTKTSPAMVQRARETAAFLESNSSSDNLHAEKMLRYAQWAREALPVAAPDVFKRASPAGAPPRFLDLGAAPGGLSCFLHGDLKWSGVAVSLAVADGGMPMMYRGAKVTNSSGNAASGRPPSSIKSPFTAAKLMRAAQKPKASTAAADGGASAGPSFAARDGDIRAETLSVMDGDTPEVAPGSCDFAMAGAVQDQSQRGDGHDAETMAALFLEQLRHRVAFLTDQLRWAHKALRRDGTATLMLVMGPAECASTAVVAAALARAATDARRVRVLSTMHVDKAPIYLLAPGIRVCDPAAGDEGDDAALAWRDLLDPARIVAEAQRINGVAEVQLRGDEGDVDADEYRVRLSAPFALPEHLDEDLDAAFAARRQRLQQQRKRAEERQQAAFNSRR